MNRIDKATEMLYAQLDSLVIYIESEAFRLEPLPPGQGGQDPPREAVHGDGSRLRDRQYETAERHKKNIVRLFFDKLLRKIKN